MPARVDQYRSLAIQARQQAAGEEDTRLKQAFGDVTEHWVGPAEQSEWLNRKHASLAIATQTSAQSPLLQQQQQQQIRSKDDEDKV
jgi:hypothetical protein